MEYVMTPYDAAKSKLKATILRIIKGNTPISFIALCDFGEKTLEKSVIRLPHEEDRDLIPNSIDYSHIKAMAGLERKKFLEDPYDEPRYERSKNDILAWQPLRRSLILLFATSNHTPMDGFELAVAANMDELKDEIDGLVEAVTAQHA
jgi:hypothetical protein